MSGFYEHDLARIHAAGYSDLSLAGGQTVLERLAATGVRTGEILDLGCGAGEWANKAVAAGFDVVGVDVSDAMLELARSNAPSARFLAASLWGFEIVPPLVAVTAFGEALNYSAPALPSLAELAGLFSRVSKALLPGGVFAFDVVVSGEPMDYRSWTDAAEYAVLVDVCEDRPAATMTRSIVTFTPDAAGYRRSSEKHVLRVYGAADVGRALSDAGLMFSSSDSYGGFALGPRRAAFLAWQPEQSDKRIEQTVSR
jgi:SAM-dependent methyltransferase